MADTTPTRWDLLGASTASSRSQVVALLALLDDGDEPAARQSLRWLSIPELDDLARAAVRLAALAYIMKDS